MKDSESNSIDATAASGFQAAPATYERGRPGYPPEAVAKLAAALSLTPASTVADLGAGTGKLTGALVPYTPRIIAIEPVPAMRRTFRRQYPAVPVIAGTAEAVPLAAGSVDAVVCAQAFHWFDGSRALAEIHRVLKPRGRLGLIWNVRDETVGWVAGLTTIMDPHAGNTPRYRDGTWKEAFRDSTLFTKLEGAEFRHGPSVDREQVVARVTSISFIARLPQEERAKIETQVHQLLDVSPETAGRERFPFPYRTHVFWCERQGEE